MLKIFGIFRTLLILTYTITLLLVFYTDATNIYNTHASNYIDILFTNSKWLLVLSAIVIFFCSFNFSDFLFTLSMNVYKPTIKDNKKITKTLSLIMEKYSQKYNIFQSGIFPDIRIKQVAEQDAYSLGHNIIILTRGLIDNASDEELAAAIAHQIGQLHNGNGACMKIVHICDIIVSLMTKVTINPWLHTNKSNYKRPTTSFALILAAILVIFFWHYIITYVIKVALSFFLKIADALTGKYKIYNSDKFVADLGFSTGLIKFLKTVQLQDIRPRNGFMAKIENMSPTIQQRIDRLENYKSTTVA
jgi:Zn-dependent protease with chaperone function